MELEALRVSGDIVAELAEGTGGIFFQNSNDLLGGFRKAADVPEHVYLLGYSPDNLKADGSFHALKVTAKGNGDLTVRARRGYYAPKEETDVKQAEKDEIQQLLFSRDEQRSFPAEVEAVPTQSGEGKLQMTVRTRVHVKALRYREEDGQHKNALTLVYGVFDRNGALVAGETDTIQLNLTPAALAGEDPVMLARRTFQIKPGMYSVRVVVQEAEERHLTALNAIADVSWPH
jgi:hypothetical protein